MQTFLLENKNGVRVKITDVGAAIMELHVPDRTGRTDDIVLGYKDPSDYLTSRTYFGASIGRYAGRIKHGEFVLNNIKYSLPKNALGHHLHGGDTGFDKALWSVVRNTSMSVTLRHLSRNGDQGYPGALDVTIQYHLTEDDSLAITYCGESTAPTIVNLTNHSYFNLLGHQHDSCLGHELTIVGDTYLRIEKSGIPIADPVPVSGTAMDFRQSRTIGSRIHEHDPQLQIADGYDHTWILNKANADKASMAAVVFEPVSGREMQVWTTEPTVHLYTANQLDGRVFGKSDARYRAHGSVCLETQHSPDSPNRPAFPSTTLNPGEVYESKTEFKFSVRD